MPSFDEIQKEMGIELTPSKYDLVRRKYLKQLSEHTGRNVILYYSGWLQKPIENSSLISIHDNDKNGFMTAIRGLDISKGLDIILHTPGRRHDYCLCM